MASFGGFAGLLPGPRIRRWLHAVVGTVLVALGRRLARERR
jgi:hypothetical protein